MVSTWCYKNEEQVELPDDAICPDNWCDFDCDAKYEEWRKANAINSKKEMKE